MRILAAAAVAAAALTLTGCPNPNAIGVQTYGSILATTKDANSGQLLAGVIVSAGSIYSCTTHPDGTCPLPQIPVGKWTVVANTAGLHGSVDVTVTENQQTSAVILMYP
jgi:hypothetical protein